MLSIEELHNEVYALFWRLVLGESLGNLWIGLNSFEEEEQATMDATSGATTPLGFVLTHKGALVRPGLKEENKSGWILKKTSEI